MGLSCHKRMEEEIYVSWHLLIQTEGSPFYMDSLISFPEKPCEMDSITIMSQIIMFQLVMSHMYIGGPIRV